MNIIKSLVSVGAALGLAWGTYSYFTVGEVMGRPAAPHQAGREVENYHALERMEGGVVYEPVSACAECHGIPPHRKNMELRAFLNLHLRALDCSVCHVRGVARYPAAETRAANRGAKTMVRVAADAKGEADAPVSVQVAADGSSHAAAEGFTFLARGLGCGDCHRRASPMLSKLGDFNSFRLRILEDLEVLPMVEKKR